MLPLAPPGWTQRFSGDLVVYEAPDAGSRVRCHQRVPLAPLSRLIAGAVGGAAWRVVARDAVVTAEGEYGALARVAVEMRGAAVERSVAAVFGDSDAVVIEADARHAAVVRGLLLGWRLGLGSPRTRRYLYQPPAGWTAMPNGLLATWLHPQFPVAQVQLVAYPAQPTAAEADEELAQLLAADRAAGAEVAAPVREVAFASPAGLAGRRWSWVVAPRGAAVVRVRRELICLRRPPYRYALKLESIDRTGAAAAADLEVLLAAARSVRPVPTPGTEWLGAADHLSQGAVAHWVE